MLAYISSKFSRVPRSPSHEPRAALFLNRFTRSSNIIYATRGVANVLGLRPADLVSKSFYYCIEECCLHGAVRCIESAKSNDTVAYLRFCFRNPLQDDNGTGDRTGYGSECQDQDKEEDDDEMQYEDCLDSQNPLDKCNITTNTDLSRPRKNCLFASPWATDSTVSALQCNPGGQQPLPIPRSPTGSEKGELMDTIRDVAVLAWAVVGTNNSLKLYGKGNPTGESQPPDGSSACLDSSSEED
ncbi:hypothetical protein RJZ90_001374 [Blastomyces dermatitidis]